MQSFFCANSSEKNRKASKIYEVRIQKDTENEHKKKEEFPVCPSLLSSSLRTNNLQVIVTEAKENIRDSILIPIKYYNASCSSEY